MNEQAIAVGKYLVADRVLDEGHVVTDGPPDDDSGGTFSLLLDGWSLAFVRAVRPVSVHFAIRVSRDTFAAGIQRLTSRGVPFGNDP